MTKRDSFYPPYGLAGKSETAIDSSFITQKYRQDNQFVYCGDVWSSAPDDAFCFFTSGPKKNLTVVVDGLERGAIQRIPPAIEDLLVIAACVHASTRLSHAGRASGNRNLQFTIGVQCLDLWRSSTVGSMLRSLLNLLTGESYSFSFVQATSGRERISYANLAGGGGFPRTVDDVVLFSGGLDSLGDAVERIALGRNVLLVSHRCSALETKIQGVLAEALMKQSPVSRLGVRVVPYDSRLMPRSTPESALLRMVLSGMAAYLTGNHRVSVSKNGVSSLKLPILKKPAAFRSVPVTHPYVLRLFGELFAEIAEFPLAFENGALLRTRAEIAEVIRDCGAASLIRHSVGCSRCAPGKGFSHCGICSDCIDRRFALMAAGLEGVEPRERYAVQLTDRSWDLKPNRHKLLSYFNFIGKLTVMSPGEFLTRFESSKLDAAALDGGKVKIKELYHLHRRYGQIVSQALSTMSSRLSQDVLEGRLPTGASLIVLSAEGLQRSTAPELFFKKETRDAVKEPLGSHVIYRRGENWAFRFNNSPIYSLIHQKGLSYISYLLARPNRVYTAYMLMEACDGIDVGSLASAISLHADDETIAMIRHTIAQLKGEREAAKRHDDRATVQRCEAEIAQLSRYLGLESGPQFKARRETRDQKRARDSVASAIKRSIKKIAKQSRPMANHLSQSIKTGFFLAYCQNDIVWETS